MPKTPRAVSSAPSTISTPPPPLFLKSLRRFPHRFPPRLRFHVLVFGLRGLPLASLLRKGRMSAILFAKFSHFLDWEISTHPTLLGVTPFLAESARPVYTLAPSALSSSVNPPTPGLGLSRPSSLLAPGDQRLTSCHFGAGIPQATRQPPSVALSGQRRSDSGGRSGVSLPRGDFGGRGATVALWMIPF